MNKIELEGRLNFNTFNTNVIISRSLPKTRMVTKRLVKYPRNAIRYKKKVYYVRKEIPFDEWYYMPQQNTIVVGEWLYEQIKEQWPTSIKGKYKWG